WVERARINMIRTSYFPSIEWPFASGITADIAHPNFRPVKETGRASSYGNTKKSATGKKHVSGCTKKGCNCPDKKPLYPAVAIQMRGRWVRDVFKPRDGHVFVICDFNAIGLCSCAQTIYDLYGHSTLRDQINRGLGPHCFMGA